MNIVGEAGELLDRFSDRLACVEIHLADIDRGKIGNVMARRAPSRSHVASRGGY